MEKFNYSAHLSPSQITVDRRYGRLWDQVLEFIPHDVTAVSGNLRNSGMRVRGILAPSSTAQMHYQELSLLQEVVDFAPVAMVAYSAAGKILLWSQAMADLTGYTKEDMETTMRETGQTPMEILYPEPREFARVAEHLRMIDNGERDEYEGVLFTLTRKDGKKRAIHWKSGSRKGGGSIRVGIDASSKRLDDTTGILNKIALNEDFEALFPAGKRRARETHTGSSTHSLVMIDLDFLKYFNDNHGHHTGDVYMNALVFYMQEKMRSGDQIYRWGGDEFVIIAQHANAEQLRVRYENIVREIATTPLYLELGGHRFSRDADEAKTWPGHVDLSSLAKHGLLPGVGMSVGISDFEIHPDMDPKAEMARVFADADRLMYYAKSTKRAPLEKRVFVSTAAVCPPDFVHVSTETR